MTNLLLALLFSALPAKPLPADLAAPAPSFDALEILEQAEAAATAAADVSPPARAEPSQCECRIHFLPPLRLNRR